eukprot:TRINITY_DN67166_c2_g1_i1.p1 TRINITY_DN67166_c2_g1~~TRINITY_DN67166_c2_g1_i1.p1  ORF type:complete len:166 (-),score=16.39 TRINITY_DN67166_c2_g1_i1:116-613(-)
MPRGRSATKVVALETGEVCRIKMKPEEVQQAAAIQKIEVSAEKHQQTTAHLRSLQKELASDFTLEGEPENFFPDCRRKTRKDRRKRARLNIDQIINDEFRQGQFTHSKTPNFMTATAPPSKYPPRSFCSVCWVLSDYTCVKCAAKFCSASCKSIHDEQRCQKFTV